MICEEFKKISTDCNHDMNKDTGCWKCSFIAMSAPGLKKLGDDIEKRLLVEEKLNILTRGSTG